MNEPKLKMIPLDMIEEPSQELRSVMSREGLEELANSIKRYGLINPITVKKKGNKYEIVAGHRRYLASKIAGKVEIPAILRTSAMADNQAIKIEENLIREDVNPMDVARYVLSILRDEELKVSQIAERLNKSPQWVNMHLRLLDLDPMTQDAIEGNQIPYASALELQKIDDPEHREMLTRSAIDGGASHRTIGSWVNMYRGDQEFQERVKSGEYTMPPTEPPNPLTFQCFWCGERHDNNDMITVRFNSECYVFLRQLKAKIAETRPDLAKEEKDGSKE